MDPNQRMLPPSTSAVTIEVSLNKRRKDLPADSISAIQVKHDASVSMRLPLFSPTRYRSEAFLVLSSTSPSARETKFVNHLEHIPNAYAVASRGSKFTRGALRSNGEECSECVSDHSKELNGGVDCKSHEKEEAQGRRVKFNLDSRGSEEKARKKQNALDRDTKRHCSPLRRQNRVHFDNENVPAHDTPTSEARAESMASSSREGDKETQDRREEGTHGNWSPINELQQIIEEEKEQQSLPNDATSTEPCEQLETSTDSVESGSEVNPLWVLDSITASVEKCSSPAYDTIFEEDVENDIVLDGHADGITQGACSSTFGGTEVEGTASQNQEEEGKDKRLSQGSDGSFGFEPHYEEDFSGYVEGKEYFKNLPTFHRLLTSAEKEELDDEQRQKNELAALRLEDQIPGLHEQSDYAQDMMDTHAMRSEYWDYPYPSRSDAFDTAMRSEDKNQLLENMRMKIRGRLRQPGNSSSDSGCQDTDANHSSLDESESAHRLNSPKGRHQGAVAEDKTKTHAETDNLSIDLSDEREKNKLKTRQEKEESSPEHPSSKRRQILEGLSRLIASSEETGLPVPGDSTLESGTEGRRNCIESGSVNEAPTIPVRPMIHGHLQFVHYENITIVKKRTDQERNPHESNKSDETHVNTRRNTQSEEIMRENESSKSGKADSRVAHSRNMESIAEPIDIDLSDPEVLEATKRMQLAFRKRRGPHGSRKLRSLQRMRAESDSVSDRILGIDSSTSFDKPNPFPVEVSLESRKVQMSRHHSLPTNLTHPSAEYNLNGDHSLSTKPKNTNTTNERLCKKLSRQKSVSLYPSSPSLPIEKPKKELTEREVVNQPVHQIDQRMEKCETSNQSMVLPEKEDIKKMSQNQSTSNGLTTSTTVTEIVRSNNALDETAESEDVDVKLKCISNSGETLTNNSETAPVEPVHNSEQEPDIDLKDPKVQDASKMIQQAFRRKKLFSKRSRGSVEEKANKKVQANKVSAGNAASNPNTSSLEETFNTLHSERSASPSILYADTTVNVVIAEVDHNNHTVSNEHHPVDQIQNKSTETRTMANEPPPVIKSASVNYQIYKGVMIVDDQLSNPLDRHPKPPLTDKENIVQVEANATFHSSFEKNKVVKRASSISEASLGDEIDIDLLDAEVKAVTEKLRSVSLVEKPPNGVKIQDHAATNETVQELNNGDAENQISPNSDPQSLNTLAKEPPVSEKVREKPKTNGDVDIDLSDPDVQKTAFKLQSAFWKKRTSSKIKSPSKEAMSGNSNKANKSTGKSLSTGATKKNKNESVIESKDGKGKSREDQSNRNELDINSKDTGESQNETSKTNQRLTSSLTCKEHEKTRQSSTNNDSMGARPQSPNANTVSLALKSSKQTEKIDIDLNDSKVKEATKKIQKIFKRKRTPTKTGETSSKGEPKKPVVRLKSNAVVSSGSKHQTKPMISTSFLDRSENGRKEAKAAMVSPDCHGNTDDDEGTKWSSNKGAVEELQKPNDGLADDNKMTHPKGEQGDQTELLSTTKESLLPSIDEYVSSKTDSTSEHKTPSTQRDDEHGGGSLVMNDVINSVPSSSDQSSVDKGPKGEKFSHDYNGSRPVSSVYADVDPSPMLPASSTSSLLRMQDEVDIEHLITTSMTTREANGVIRNVSPATCFSTSLTTAPLSRRNRDRDDDADSLRLKSSSTAVTHAKSVHGYLEQASDDTEYETAYSDFSDRVDDELERTLVKDDVISTELIQMETTIHHHSPRFLIRPKNASCCHGDRARFVCCITGTPRPDISWFASGKVIRPERDNRLQITDYSEDNDGKSNACALVSILDIVEVKFLDNGEYACVAINSQGQAFSSAHLTVAEPDAGPVEESAEDENDRLSSQNNYGASAKVDMKSSIQDLVHVSSASLPRQKVQALVGSKASFFCPVEGDPPLDVKWFKDDVPITSNSGDDRIAVRVEGCVHCLHIQDISLSDQGTYVCSAANDRGSVLCASLLEVQESSELDGNQQVKQHTPMLVITEPEKFRQPLENNAIVPLQAKTEETVVPFDSSNAPNTNESNHCGRINSDEGEVKVVGDSETEDINDIPHANSGAEHNGNSDEILSSVLSTYGPRDLPESHSDDRLSVLSNEGVTFKESNGSENYASAEGPPSDENQQTKNKIANGTIPYEGDSLLEAKHHKSSKRRSSRRNHVKSPTKNNHSTSPGDKDVIEDIGLDDVNGLTRSKSSRKKRSSSRRKKSPIHSKNVERVRLDLEKAEELTEKVDSCLDIIDDLLTLTSYDENENETEEKLRQKLDTLVHKFADSESDAASLSSRRSTPSHLRKEKLRKVDLLQLSDSNGECLDASAVNLNVSRLQSDGNIWGPCSLEDSLKVMSDLVGNISVTVRDQEQKPDYPANANSTETVTNNQEGNLNNNNNVNQKGISNKGLHSGQNIKRTPLRELLKHSLFSQELMTTRIRRRPLPVTRSLDSVDDYTNIPRTFDGRRRHSFGSLYAPRASRPARHPLLRTLSMRRRNRTHSVESSSSDDDSPDRFRGVNIVRRPRPLETGRASDDCPSHAESTDSLPVELEDKFQQFPDGDRLSSPIGFEDSDCSLEDHNLPDRTITTRFVNNGNFIPGKERLPEYGAVETEPELSKDSVGEDSPSTNQHKIGGVSQSGNYISKRSTDNDQEYMSKHENIVRNSSKTGDITWDNVSHNGTHSDRIPQENGSYTQDKDVDEDDDDHADTLLNVSRNDSGFSSGPLSTDKLDNLISFHDSA